MQIRWLAQAIENLDNAATWIAKDNRHAAEDFVTAVQKTVLLIAQVPSAGKVGRVLGTREMIVLGYPYIIPYRVVGDELQILRVFHVRQQSVNEW